MRIVDLDSTNMEMIQQAAALLVEGFKEHWPGSWSDMSSAMETLRELVIPDNISRAAIDDDERVVGWVGAQSQYHGHVWELHPLVVHPLQQRKGIGSALVHDLEACVAARGGLTILLGSDDEDDMTSLAGVDLYQNTWQQIAAIRNLRGHPYTFYMKLGFTIVGVVPDANGLGKPDILMAKRVRSSGLNIAHESRDHM